MPELLFFVAVTEHSVLPFENIALWRYARPTLLNVSFEQYWTPKSVPQIPFETDREKELIPRLQKLRLGSSDFRCHSSDWRFST